MKKALLLGTLVLTGWLSAPRAQAHKANGNGNGSGSFTASDGTAGTYVETRVVSGTTTTDTLVFTTTDLSETGTDTTATTVNTDGSKTVVYTHIALGATVPSILSITYPAVTTTTTTSTTTANCASGAGGLSVSLYGTGSLTSAAGALATLSAFVTTDGSATVTSIDFATTLLSLARELRVVETSGQSKVITTIDVDLTGVATTETLTLTATASASGHGHH